MLEKPLSPHLSIYKPQITSITSIIGRLCGIYTYFIAILLFWMITFSIYKYNSPLVPIYIIIMAIKTSTLFISLVLYVMLFITTFCVTFFAGTLIRHILWDHNIALELKTASTIGYIIIASATLLSITVVSLIAIM